MRKGIFYQTSINLTNNLSTNFSPIKETNNFITKIAKDNLLQKYTENKRVNKYQLQIMFPYHLFNKFSLKTDEELNDTKLDLSKTITNHCKVLDKERRLLNSIWENDYQKYLLKTDNLLKFKPKLKKTKKPNVIKKLYKEIKENNFFMKMKSSKAIMKNKKDKIKVKPLRSMKNLSNAKKKSIIKYSIMNHTPKNLINHKKNSLIINERSNHLFNSSGSKLKKRNFKLFFNKEKNEVNKINNDFRKKKIDYKQSWVQNKFYSPKNKTIYNNYLLFNKQQHSRLRTNVNTLENKMTLSKLGIKIHNSSYKI